MRNQEFYSATTAAKVPLSQTGDRRCSNGPVQGAKPEKGQAMFRLLCILLVIGLALAACASSESAGDLEAEAGLIRTADRTLLEAETRRDLEGAMVLFAEDAVLQPPDAPPVIGREAVREFYADWFGVPYVGIYSDSDRVIVSASYDLAYLIGTSHMEMDTSAGGERFDGKYISLWRKVDGRWLCVGVSWSGNAPSG